MRQPFQNILAALPPPESFEAIGWTAVALSGVVLMVERGMAMARHFKSTPPTAELALTHAHLAKRLGDLEAQREEDLRTGSERRKQIYAELKSQREDFQGELKSVYSRIERNEREQNEVLRRLPDQIVALLKNTGVIK